MSHYNFRLELLRANYALQGKAGGPCASPSTVKHLYPGKMLPRLAGPTSTWPEDRDRQNLYSIDSASGPMLFGYGTNKFPIALNPRRVTVSLPKIELDCIKSKEKEVMSSRVILSEATVSMRLEIRERKGNHGAHRHLGVVLIWGFLIIKCSNLTLFFSCLENMCMTHTHYKF